MFPWHWWKPAKDGWGVRYCILCQQKQKAFYDDGKIQWEPVA
jgi:hypothetical protein